MPNTTIYTQALMDHVAHPDYNYELDDATCSHEGINPSCGDDLTLHVRLTPDGTIDETSWTGSGCAISQASADMMSELVEGKTIAEARDACALFTRMIRGEETDPTVLAQLEDASCFESISHMPARVKCAELAWRTLDEMLSQSLNQAPKEVSN
ncbi:MAG: SUF system NifU family Fe-S cluster assembly protein [Atopobium sp.]|uniref:Fe-S cluster assembly sulfur transfer protein SufU n=1 Tax=Atopobium sp. TaxID=1872650 RepID=UPI002A7F929B|nr:SUF system NifU family Fe-S cluster assembly protein [Atopobium sp.]MDY4522304.1 SUF system NifU family Fe-S cluster assembly protein [Atopobium sp.]